MHEWERVAEDLRAIRDERPLVHNITNYVVMNTTANTLLSLGASPVMAHAAEEVEEMTALAKALVINIGTLSGAWVDSMHRAARTAKARRIPVILDPVGAGATRMRTEAALSLLRGGWLSVVRGNPSEIMALAGAASDTKGVDAVHGPDAALVAANSLAREYGCTVSVSGAVDLITDGRALLRVANGHPMMPRVTGLGCAAAAITGAFAAVDPSSLSAAAYGMAVTGIAGEMAGERADGPGSFQLRFLDALYRLGDDAVRDRLRLDRA